jgi:hypothetical protein
MKKVISRLTAILDPDRTVYLEAQLLKTREDLQSLAELVEVQYEVVNALSDQMDALGDRVVKLQKRRANKKR